MKTKTEIMDTLLAERLHCACAVGIPTDAGSSDIWFSELNGHVLNHIHSSVTFIVHSGQWEFHTPT